MAADVATHNCPMMEAEVFVSGAIARAQKKLHQCDLHDPLAQWSLEDIRSLRFAVQRTLQKLSEEEALFTGSGSRADLKVFDDAELCSMLSGVRNSSMRLAKLCAVTYFNPEIAKTEPVGTLLHALTHAQAVASYNDSKLTELLPVAKLVRFLRLEPPDEPLSTEGASLRTTRTLPHGSLHVTIRNLVHTSTSTEDADGEADATEESALDALEDAMAMLDDFHRAVSQVVQTRDRMACEKAIKAQEAEALREEAEKLTPLLTQHVLHVGLDKGTASPEDLVKAPVFSDQPLEELIAKRLGPRCSRITEQLICHRCGGFEALSQVVLQPKHIRAAYRSLHRSIVRSCEDREKKHSWNEWMRRICNFFPDDSLLPCPSMLHTCMHPNAGKPDAGTDGACNTLYWTLKHSSTAQHLILLLGQMKPLFQRELHEELEQSRYIFSLVNLSAVEQAYHDVEQTRDLLQQEQVLRTLQRSPSLPEMYFSGERRASLPARYFSAEEGTRTQPQTSKRTQMHPGLPRTPYNRENVRQYCLRSSSEECLEDLQSIQADLTRRRASLPEEYFSGGSLL